MGAASRLSHSQGRKGISIVETVYPASINIKTTNLDNYRVSVVLKYTALITIAGHVLLIPLFTWLGVSSLALFDTVGVAIWVFVLFLNRAERHDVGFFLGFVEVVASAFLGVAVLGWRSGFHYYIIPTVLFLLVFPMWQDLSRLIAPILLCALYIALNLYSRTATPMVMVDPWALNLLNALNIIVLFVALSAFAHKYRVAVRIAERELKEANRDLDLLAGTDPLTGLLNRRHILEIIEIEMSRLERGGKPLVLVMGDVDDFKSFNDEYGHECGDSALVYVSNLMKESLRNKDRLARWGGDEFLILLPETGPEGGGVVAERVREAIESISLSHCGRQMSVKMSFGMSVCARPGSIKDYINRADQALYAAKRKGKNSVVLWKEGLPGIWSLTSNSV